MDSNQITPNTTIDNNTLKLLIQDPEKIVFEGMVHAVSSFNEVGLFDILPLHQNFISIINQKIIIRQDEKTKQEIEIKRGIIKVLKNQVFIFLGV